MGEEFLMEGVRWATSVAMVMVVRILQLLHEQRQRHTRADMSTKQHKRSTRAQNHVNVANKW